MTSTSETSNEATGIGATPRRVRASCSSRGAPATGPESSALVRPLDRFTGGSEVIVRQMILTGRDIRNGQYAGRDWLIRGTQRLATS